MKNTIHQIIATCLLLCFFLTVKGQVEKLEFISEGKKLNTYFYEATGTESKPTLLWLHGNPVGPDAEPFIAWRASMSDEQWVDWNAANDEDWYKSVEQDFGLNAR